MESCGDDPTVILYSVCEHGPLTNTESCQTARGDSKNDTNMLKQFASEESHNRACKLLLRAKNR